MGWFESQIEERRRADDRRLDESLRGIAGAVTGRHAAEGADAAALANSALLAVLRYYGAADDSAEKGGAGSAADVSDIEKYLEDRLRVTGIMCRPVRLASGWEKEAVGAMLGFAEDGTPTALIPRARGGYTCYDPKTDKNVAVGSTGAPKLDEKAYCFYRPLPAKPLGVKELVAHMLHTLDASDYVVLIAAAAVTQLMGMLTPRIQMLMFGPVIQSGTNSMVPPIIALMVGVGISSLFIGIVSGFVSSRVSTKLNIPLQASIMMRVLSLPASFFADHETGELSERMGAVTSLTSTLQSMGLSTLLSTLFSLGYIFQIAGIAPALLLPALGYAVVSSVITLVVGFAQVKLTKKRLEAASELSNVQYALLSGVQKIKLAGAEKRAFANWADAYSAQAELTYNGPAIVRLAGTIQTAVSLVGTTAIYAAAIAGGVNVAQYVGFTAAYGAVTGAFASLTSAVLQIAQIGPNLERAEPILKTIPESAAGKAHVSKLSGGFELDHVSFSYAPGQPKVLEDISLKVRPGSYVAIVGKTGCGKSTLLRLLLGFETPQSGAVYYDGRDLSSLDVQGMRRNIGVVLQDGKLFQGSIYDNISISAPGLSMDDAWRAAELAGFADDIRNMPMGMQTLISEGGGGVSGGQRQRLMIARAVAGKPRIIMFDEATSALDNVTQRIVSESLDELKCTRLVIAHRLSTIRHCERIVLIDGGHIAEDGTYDELMALGGQFAELVARQQV
ncbi:NHLP bacteriocin export ABC transporter permease/ATPase subunit [Paratractidigestivibacter sp.]|uniref:NHLP bacteriocin export ABC transporter permease/ATPase subunit n=1 Tax=Paratractidigestivibacter sp. TaxID=2847316 RepID=UPI002AC91CC7|nr:NHLP bacteriocin export ABC transporter permease/ATPase subunit [Paratractidigestivibacter sp.]